MWPQTRIGSGKKRRPSAADKFQKSVLRKLTGTAAAVLAFLCALLAVTAFPGTAAADPEVEFYAVADKESISEDDRIALTLTLSYDAMDGAEVLLLPEFAPDFRVISKSQSDQNSFQLSGGKSTIRRVRIFRYTLAPTKPGKLVIPSGKLKIGGKNYETAPITISVAKSANPVRSRGRSASPGTSSNSSSDADDDDDSASGSSSSSGKRSSQGGQSPFAAAGVPDPFGLAGLGGLMDEEDLEVLEMLFGLPGRAGQERRQKELQDSDLFIRAVLDKKKAYIGEQVTMSIILYARTDVAGVNGMRMPKLDGFWSEDIDSPSKITAERRVIDGVAYRAFLLRRKALFPLKAGKLTIDRVEADIDISVGFFFSGGRKVQRKSAPVTIQVLPLPQNAPKEFEASNVGTWNITAEASPSSVPLGQPVTLKVNLEGKGNLKNISLPPLPTLDGFRAYEPTTTERITTSRNKFGGRRTFEYILMPTRIGNFTLPAIDFSFFDPAQKKYKTVSTKPISLKVTAGTGAQIPLSSLQQGSGIQAAAPAALNVLESEGLKPLHYKGDIQKPRQILADRSWFLPVTSFPLVLWLLLIAGGTAKSALAAGRGQGRERFAGRKMRRRLKKAKHLIDVQDADKFYAEIADILSGYVSERSGKSASGMTRPELRELLTGAGMSDTACDSLVRVLDTCDAGRFAPGAAEKNTMNQILEEASAALQALEDLKLEAPSGNSGDGGAAK